MACVYVDSCLVVFLSGHRTLMVAVMIVGGDLTGDDAIDFCGWSSLSSLIHLMGRVGPFKSSYIWIDDRVNPDPW